MDQTEAELESFRQQWREEVQARSKKKSDPPTRLKGHAKSSSISSKPPPEAQPSLRSPKGVTADTQKRPPGDDIGPAIELSSGRRENAESSGKHIQTVAEDQVPEPRTALEHYEKAVEKESQGNLGDSVRLYRKAFKLDERVHEIYKNKHFPPPSTIHRKGKASLSQGAGNVPSQPSASSSSPLGPLSDLLTTFSGLKIEGEPPPTDFSPAPACPIAVLPEEILAEILLFVAIVDVASYARLANVCKRLAYLVMTDDRIWRRIALGPEFGFAAMHYKWACRINGKSLGQDGKGGKLLTMSSKFPPSVEFPQRTLPPSLPYTTLVPDPYSSHRNMLRRRSRIRFNGVYISTVNYTRPGGNSSMGATWGTPVLIVTYYRYLRFYRDGAVISLLTTSEPADVIPHFSAENVRAYPYLHAPLPPAHGRQAKLQAAAQAAALPAVMKDALPGRWRLSGPDEILPFNDGDNGDDDGEAREDDDDDGDDEEPFSSMTSTAIVDQSGDSVFNQTAPPLPAPAPAPAETIPDPLPPPEPEPEGTLHVETDGVVPKYRYVLALSVSSVAGAKASRRGGGTKLTWQGYWSYNRLADDWAEFGLKNDRAFYYTRVGRFGVGGEAGWREVASRREGGE